MGTIEDTLRETFAAEVAAPPTLEGVADRAISQAGRARRTRMSIGAAAAMVAVLLVGVGTVALYNQADPVTPTAAAPKPNQSDSRLAAGVDVLLGDEIWTTDGRTIPLVETTTPLSAYRVVDSWLVLAQDIGATDRSLWFVQSDGTPKRLVTGAGIAVSPDGRQVAWATGDLLRVADLVDGRLINQRQTGGRRGLVPYAFAGEAVLLTAADFVYSGPGTPPFDLWFPSRGAYVPGPTPTRPVFAMGLAPGGARLLGMSALGAEGPDGRELCLAELDLGSLEPTRHVCGLPISPIAAVSISPDGHHAMITNNAEMFMIDLATVFEAPLVLGEWDGIYTGPVAWTDANTVVVSDPYGLAVLHVTGQDVSITAAGLDLDRYQKPLVIPRLR
jgi:hypothetical protein